MTISSKTSNMSLKWILSFLHITAESSCSGCKQGTFLCDLMSLMEKPTEQLDDSMQIFAPGAG